MIAILLCLWLITAIIAIIVLGVIRVISFCELEHPFRKWVRKQFIKERAKDDD